jgi:hypothetical protein
MNEQIRQLAHKAEFIIKKNNGAEWRWGHIDPELAEKLEKFAELIIKQCANIVVNADLGDVYGGDSAVLFAASQQIKEHFGV